MNLKTRISNKEVNKTLKHIEQLQKKIPHHKDITTQGSSSILMHKLSINVQDQSQIIPPKTPDVQPWLQEMQNSSQTMKKQQNIRRQINFMLGVNQEEEKETKTQIQKPDFKKIAKKLQKYQPANSSFSLYLSEMKELQRLKHQDSEQKQILQNFKLKGLNLPPILIPTSQKKGNVSSRLKIIDRKRAISLNNVSYIGHIKQIYSLGQTASQFPGELIQKIDRATKAIDRKYEQLNNKTIEMTADVGTYHLQQQNDRNYKKNLLSIPRWMIKKKV